MRPIGELTDWGILRQPGLGAKLALPQAGIAAQHIQNDEVNIAVAIDIGEVNAHGIFAGMTDSQSWGGSKNALAIV